MRCLLYFLIACLILFVAQSLHAHIIHVPADSATIQGGINGAVDGDTVMVADGTYTGDGNRDIDFGGKDIVVMSENGPENCIIDCESNGRGFYFHNGEVSTSVLQGFKIKRGYDVNGGGLYCDSSSPMIIKCTFSGNAANDDGGGMYNYYGNPTVANCTFMGNSAYRGGGMSNLNSDPTVTNCTFIGNSANGAGGMSNRGNGPTVANCLFIGNSANVAGGMYNYYSNPTVTNCTFTENSANLRGGMSNSKSSPMVTNCIFWNDSPNEIAGQSIVVTYSDVEGGYPGVGNIDVDPRFVSFYGFDYLLQSTSPCIDKGDPTIEDYLYDWHPRWPDWYPNGPRSDMGAYGGPDNKGWLR